MYVPQLQISGFSMFLNWLGTMLQHLFRVRVTKVAGFLRPTSPWLHGRSPRCPAKAPAQEISEKGFGLIAQGPIGPAAYGSRKSRGGACFDFPDRAILTSESPI
jgi:hypothetical protein